ncbi:hypothetical protein AB9F43_15645 [Rhizobium leguminosarum]|uniref:hypothetical protein n=1 Tax=Rhizobium leguminosarum TaxID=384 RepID=UPI003F98DC7D
MSDFEDLIGVEDDDEKSLVLAENDPEWKALVADLERRCVASGRKFNKGTFEDLDGLQEEFVHVELPNGKETRKVTITTKDELKAFLDSPFEKLVFLGDLDAICSYEDGIIEATIRPFQPSPSSTVIRRIQSYMDPIEAGVGKGSTIDLADKDNPALKVTIQPMSAEMQGALTSLPMGSRTTLLISGITVKQHDQALRLLNKIADALFFQIDVCMNLPLRLVKSIRRPDIRVRRPSQRRPPLLFPQYEYDAAPISLYWYGRSANGMPLLQFLAYYQVLEFYFPAYSQKETARRIQNILKDPRFRKESDTDIASLLSVVKASRSGSYGGEREQLRATLNECTDAAALRGFFEDGDERKSFFGGKKLPLTKHKLSLGQADADLRSERPQISYTIFDAR